MPMGGLTLAFKSFKTRLGILASPWNGTTNFESLFRDPAFFRSVGITLWINFIELAAVLSGTDSVGADAQ